MTSDIEYCLKCGKFLDTEWVKETKEDYCSLECKVNHNFGKLNDILQNHKKEIESINEAHKSDTKWSLIISLIMFASLLSLILFMGIIYTDKINSMNEHQNELTTAFNNLKNTTNTNIFKICEFENYSCTIDGVMMQFD